MFVGLWGPHRPRSDELEVIVSPKLSQSSQPGSPNPVSLLSLKKQWRGPTTPMFQIVCCNGTAVSHSGVLMVSVTRCTQPPCLPQTTTCTPHKYPRLVRCWRFIQTRLPIDSSTPALHAGLRHDSWHGFLHSERVSHTKFMGVESRPFFLRFQWHRQIWVFQHRKACFSRKPSGTVIKHLNLESRMS